MKKFLMLLVLFLGGCSGGYCDRNSPVYDPERCERFRDAAFNAQQQQAHDWQQQTQQSQQNFQMQQMQQDLQELKMGQMRQDMRGR